jgi:hypothetical protein
MKTITAHRMLMIAVLTGSAFLTACKSDDGPKDLNVKTIKAGEIDLNGAVSPTNVPLSPTITVVFNTPINATTANNNSVKVVADYNNTAAPITISVTGATLTITPSAPLGGGTLYRLEITPALTNNDNKPLAALSRTFTTIGTFLPAGVVARWTFEGNANDVAGTYNPSANGIVAVTYTPSKNTKLGNAATFNGTSSIIEIPNADPLMNTSNFTISFWMKTVSANHVDANGNPKGHFVIGMAAFRGIQFEVFGNYEGAKFAISYVRGDNETTAEDMWFPSNATDATNGGWQGWDFAKALTPVQMQAKLKDAWVHVTYTYNGTSKTGTLYYDGEKMKSFSFNLWPEGDAKRTITGMKYGGQAPGFVNELAFGFIHSRAGTEWDSEPWGGYDFPTANHFRGQLDDIKIYHKVLTPTEIQLMYDSEK